MSPLPFWRKMLDAKPEPLMPPVANPDADAMSDVDADDPEMSTNITVPRGVIMGFALFTSFCVLYLILDGDKVVYAGTVIFTLMEQEPFLGFLGFVGIYTFNSMLCLPVFPLILGAGYISVRTNGIFPGIPFGCLQVSVASTVAAAMVFTFGRNACRSRVTLWARKSKVVHVEELLMKHKGLQVVALLRMTSFLPFGATSYVLSATSVRFRDYFLGTIIGLSPFIIVEVSAGASLSSLAAATQIANSTDRHVSKLQYSLLVFSLLLTLFASFYIARLARAELAAVRERHSKDGPQKIIVSDADTSRYKEFTESEFGHSLEATSRPL